MGKRLAMVVIREWLCVNTKGEKLTSSDSFVLRQHMKSVVRVHVLTLIIEPEVDTHKLVKDFLFIQATCECFCMAKYSMLLTDKISLTFFWGKTSFLVSYVFFSLSIIFLNVPIKYKVLLSECVFSKQYCQLFFGTLRMVFWYRKHPWGVIVGFKN